MRIADLGLRIITYPVLASLDTPPKRRFGDHFLVIRCEFGKSPPRRGLRGGSDEEKDPLTPFRVGVDIAGKNGIRKLHCRVSEQSSAVTHH